MIYLIWAPPSEGKTYFATAEAVRIMTSKHPRRVFSNYPIVYREPLSIISHIINVVRRIQKKPLIQPKIYSTYKWEQEYMYLGLNNCVIFLDEAYRFFSSRKKDVGVDEHTFFATNGHDGNDIYLIAQHYIRLDTIIREMASYFVFIWKTSNPLSFSGAREGEITPLFFTCEMYISEEDYKFRHIKEDAVWMKKRILFRKNIAESYDTKYFKKTEKTFSPTQWTELINTDKIDAELKQGIEMMA